MNKIQSDLLAVNVSWFLEDLELYDGQYGFSESICFTVARLVILIMAIFVHSAFYKRLLLNCAPVRPGTPLCAPVRPNAPRGQKNNLKL